VAGVTHAALLRAGERVMVVPGFATADLAMEFGVQESGASLEYLGTVEVLTRKALRALAAGAQTRRLVARMGGQPGTGNAP
jgi:hypothetical protein